MSWRNTGHPSLVGRQVAETLFFLLFFLTFFSFQKIPSAYRHAQQSRLKISLRSQCADAEMQELSPKGSLGLAEAYSMCSAPVRKQRCQTGGLSWPPPSLIAVEMSLVLLPSVGGGAQNSTLCFSDLYTSVWSGSFEGCLFGFFLLSSETADLVKLLLKCLHWSLYCGKLLP